MKKPNDTAKEYCAICKDFHDFVLPKDLFEALVNHELVIFAGAGVSTENKNVFPSTLYEDICEELGYSCNKGMPFSKVMSKYCRKKGGRRELIDRIITRIDYIRSFPQLYSSTVRFHEQLAMVPCITEIVTTNWDDFFEIECHATPFVYEQDMALWDRPKRKVLKLHGSINNLGSIVVTSEDYEKRYQSLRTGLIGSQLKLLIANRQLVFIGYSFGDEDFNRIYSFVCSQVNDFMKRPYIVTLDKLNDEKWKGLGLEPIYTAGEYFLQVLTHNLKLKGCILSKQSITAVQKELRLVMKEHLHFANNVKLVEQPEVIYCLSYQDGIIHAFEHFLSHIEYGESLCKPKLLRVLESYETLIKKKEDANKWFDVAYLKGYLNGHIFVLASKEERKDFPRYLDLSLNNELHTFDEYIDSLSISEGRTKSITGYASRFIKKFPPKTQVIQHTPFL